jgi:SpoVK/Ycf46/Vps4 family AAA+-type ATPase
VIVSSQLALPPEAEKEIAVVEYPLPEVEELASIVDKLAALVVSAKPPSGEERRAIAEAALGLTAEEAEATMAKSLVQCGGSFDVEVITGEKAKIVAKSGILEFVKTHQSMNDIGGLDQLKGWLRKRRAAFAPEAREFGLPSPRGLLMLGIPGGGKSLTAKAIGSAWKLPLLRLDMGKIFAGMVGSSEENMRRAIATAEAVAPSILWIDELEKGFSGTGSSNSSDGGTAARVFGSFITWMQEKTSPVFVVATANNVSQLPPEMLRKGRFDEIFFVDLPSLEERKQIAMIHIARRGRELRDFDVTSIAEASAGFTGAEIEQAVVSALFDAYDTGGAKGKLTTDGILEAVRETMPLSKTMKEGIDTLRAWSGSRARPASTPPTEGRGHRGIDLS